MVNSPRLNRILRMTVGAYGIVCHVCVEVGCGGGSRFAFLSFFIFFM
jgi:hypothetical protein